MKATYTANYISNQVGFIVEIKDENNLRFLKIDGRLKVFTSGLVAKYACDFINLNNN